jgi:hypothetical protein
MENRVQFEVHIKCSKCGRAIDTTTEADLDETMEVKVQTKRGWYDRKTAQPLQPFRRIVLCNACADKRIAERDEVQEKSRMQQWHELCPASYRETEAHKLPSPTRLERVMRWKYNAKGLLLIGATGKGKSRCAWKLMEREFFAGRTVECLDAKFAIEYAGKMNLGPAIALEWIGGKMNAALLLLDDTLKVRLENTGAETALFAIIEDRMANKRPIILTTQDTGDTLRSRMSADRGEATVRRLRECCETISFD